MKKKLIIVLIVIVLSTTVYYFFFRRTAYTIASNITNFKVSTSLKVEQFQDDWANNPNGDGESFILFSFNEKDKENLVNACKKNNYKLLPIKDTLPDNFIYKYIQKENQTGFYKLNKDKKDERSYTIAVLNLLENKLIVYNVIW